MTPATMSMRLEPQPGEVIDRSDRFTFTFDGREFPAYRGDTIASALAASGQRTLSRSLKYHRPRGMLTASWLDPGCLVQVGGEPNVRAAHRLVRPGMAVRAQNAWPSLRFDAKAVNRLLGPALSAGFYYKTFMRPRFAWPWYSRALRRFANGGTVPSPGDPAPPERAAGRYAHPDVVVAGGGPAGMAAALAAAREGASVLLVEEDLRLGGHLCFGGEDELALLRGLAEEIAAEPRIEVLTDAVVLGRYDANRIAVLCRGEADGAAEHLVKARPSALVAAPGLVERPYVIAGNDLPGVLLSTAVRRLVHLYAVRPGERAAVLTANGSGDAAAADLKRAGVEIAHIADTRVGEDVAQVLGRSGVRGVRLGDGRRVDCDLFVTATGWSAPLSLLTMAGARPVYSPRAARFLPGAEAAGAPGGAVLPAGGIAGDGGLEELIGHARAVGARAAGARTPIPELGVEAHPALFRGSTHGMVDFCEDVSSKDIVQAVAEGYDSVELAKRYTTATMGHTQGRLEAVNTAAVVAEATGADLAEVGMPTGRPPYVPATLGALAGREFEPVRRSPMQDWHERRGAVAMAAGAWVRPEHYGDPEAEVRTVRERVGLIDITPIGKLDLRGPDVPRLLDLLYVNKWARLDAGRVRYGAMCGEDGVVLDDGVTARLGAEHYLMTATSAGSEAVEEWVERWLRTEHPDWRVHLTPMTTAYASMNLAGPASRELLGRLAEGLDLSNEAFGYLHARTGRVAGVEDCVLWRIGFTGELSYEIHVPAGYGLHVWEALLERGGDLGIGVFGVEAQRILRLEKGHAIVGQDTDGLTRGYSAALDWAIKLDKDDFVGKQELAWQRAAGGYPRLVGLRPVDGATVPAEGSQIVERTGAGIVGRVTSSRMSPTLGRPVCLAQLAGHLAEPGTRVEIRLPSGRTTGAEVTERLAQFDPDGGRMRA